MFNSGFNNTSVIDPEKNDGQQGAVSAIVLCFGCPAVVPPEATILSVGVDWSVPAEPGTGQVRYQEGLAGTGQPVDIVVTQAGSSPVIATEGLEVELSPIVSCGPPLAAYALGFATESIRSTEAFAEGFIGAGEADGPDGPSNLVVIESATGDVGGVTLFPTFSSNVPGGGIQGWSISIEATGAARIVSATLDGTSAANVPDGRYDSGFRKTELAVAENNDGREGVLSAIVLCFGCGVTLDPVGTESVLQIGVEAAEPQGPEPQTGRLSYASLTGSAESVDIVLTVDGSRAAICNRDTVGLDISFEETLGKGPFIRGDANDDSVVDVADGIWILAEQFRGGPASVCQSAADANADGRADIADATYLLSFQFRGGPAPEFPFEECDLIDIDADDLECPTGHSSCRE